MCHACVMDSVKNRMLSRRSFLKATAAATTATAAGAVVGTTSAMADGHTKVADMTHTLGEDFPTYFGEQHLFIEQKWNFAEHKVNLNELRVNEHTGTHMDLSLIHI